MLVHLDSELLLQNYLAIPVTIPNRLVERLPLSAPPKNWRTYPAPSSTRTLGDAWLSRAASPVLQLPSVVIPSESNFLLSPTHPLFPKLRIAEPLSLLFAPHLKKIRDSLS